jgi:glycosyltransferase involved in cell wall biosynthesis
MRLLFIIDGLGSGGAGRQMALLVAGLHDRGYNIEGFVYRPENNYNRYLLDERSILIHSIEKSHRFSIKPVTRLKNILAGNKYNAIFSFLSTPNVYTELMRIWYPKLPIIVSIRSSYPNGKISFAKYLKEQLHRVATHITVNSHNQRELMIKVHPWMNGRISTIYNGIDLKSFKPMPSSERITNQVKLLVLGKIRKVKNMTGLIKGLYHYKKSYSDNILIHWAGKLNNNLDDKKSYEDAQYAIREYNLENNWHWLGEKYNIQDLINKYDAIVLPSIHEGLPNAICEALSCGKPVLASNVCDHPRLVEDGVTGFLFNPHDPVDIAETLKKFSSISLDKRTVMGYNARKFAERELSLEKFISCYEELFIRIIKNN